MHSKDIAEEIDRLSGLGLVDHASERRQSIYRRHVAAFSRQLRPSVAQALEVEARRLAEEWLDNVESMVGWLLKPEADEGAETLQGRHHESHLTDMGKEHLIATISASLQENPGKVTDEEIEEHAVELAQLLLSNWVGILEQAFADAPGQAVVLLEYKALPPQTDPNALGRGCEAYALAVDDCVKALLTYQESLVSPGSKVDISADIQLHRSTDGRWHAFRSGSEIVLRDAAAEISAEQRREAAYHRITCRMADDLMPRVVGMRSSSDIDTERVKRLVMMAARDVVVRQQRNERMSSCKHHGRAVHLQQYGKNATKDEMQGSSRGDKLARNVGNMVRLLLQGEAEATSWKPPQSHNWIHSVGRLNSADLCFVALPAVCMAEWMVRHNATTGIDEDRPEGDTEKWLVKSAARIAQTIRSENGGMLDERVWAQISES